MTAIFCLLFVKLFCWLQYTFHTFDLFDDVLFNWIKYFYHFMFARCNEFNVLEFMRIIKKFLM